MRQRRVVEDLDNAVAPSDSELSDIDEPPGDDNVTVATQLALIIEKLASLESRLDRLEGQVNSKTARRTAQARPHAVEPYEISGGSPIANNTLSHAPVTPRRVRVQPSMTLLSPIQRASPRHVRTQPAESQSSGQASPRMTQNTPTSSSTRQRHLPAHYFSPNPILTPDQVLQANKDAPDGPYFVVTQGIEPGIYKEWYEVVSLAKNVRGGAWTKKDTKNTAIETYRTAYYNGYCMRINT